MKIQNLIMQLTPQRVFLVLALLFGTLFVFINKPFNVPDEPAHFFRIYQLSDFKILGERHDLKAGGQIPTSVIETTSDLFKKNMDIPLVKKHITQNLNPNKKVFYQFENTVIYSPIGYIPQITAVVISKIINAPPIVMFYFARILNLLAYVGLLYIAIKIIPIFKWGLALLALMPMAITQAASLSIDSVTISLSFLLIAYILNCAFEKERIAKKNMAIIILLSTLMGLCKLAYIFIPFLFLLIPSQKFNSKKDYFISLFAVIFIPLTAIFVWGLLVKGLYIPMLDYASPQAQLNSIIFHPLIFLKAFVKSLIELKFLHSFVGNLGWFDNPMPIGFVIVYLLIVLLAACFESNKIDVSLRKKVISAAIVMLSIFMLEFLLYLHWNRVGSTKIDDLQGRYYIPIAPIFLILFQNKICAKLKITENTKNLFYTVFLVVSLLFTAFWIK